MPDSPTFTDWIAAATGLLALLAAGVAAYAAWRAFQTQRTELSLLVEDRRRDQAARIACWRSTGVNGELSFRVNNSSDVPVTDVVLIECNDDGHVLTGADSGGAVLLSAPPGATDIAASATGGATAEFWVEAVPPMLRFRDAKGRHWVRWPRGHLEEDSGLRETVKRLYGPDESRWPADLREWVERDERRDRDLRR